MPVALLVKTSEIELKCCRLALEKEGFMVVGAGNFEEALFRLSIITPDVIVCDLNYTGESALEVIDQARLANPPIRTILLSGNFVASH